MKRILYLFILTTIPLLQSHAGGAFNCDPDLQLPDSLPSYIFVRGDGGIHVFSKANPIFLKPVAEDPHVALLDEPAWSFLKQITTPGASVPLKPSAK